MATRAQRRQATQNRMKAMSSQLRAEAFRLIRDRGPMSPKEVAEELEVKVRDLNYHIRKLEEFDCIEEVGTRRIKSVLEHLYAATERHMIDTDEWEDLATQEPEMAEFLVDEFMQSIVDDYTESRRAGIVGLDEQFFIVRVPLWLDSKGLREARKASVKYQDEMVDIAARSAARHGEEGTDEVPVSFSIAWFKMPKRDKPRPVR
ncbi:MAG TPA: helix-turn-helix domain-containing protein [Solirubrobacterales bacterium]|nr:helix-turn-helix domain-containing protein [Solirubrobacterales bacterium]